MKADVALYKGRKYKVKWTGKTKYGQRAHLAFFDDSKSFWVDADKISVVDNPSPAEKVYGRGRGGQVVKCRECGGWAAPGDPCNEPCEF